MSSMTDDKMVGANRQRMAVLRMISLHDAEWSWYQLDRALSINGIILGANLMSVLKEMERKDLLLLIPTADPAYPVYKLTDKAWTLVGSH